MTNNRDRNQNRNQDQDQDSSQNPNDMREEFGNAFDVDKLTRKNQNNQNQKEDNNFK